MPHFIILITNFFRIKIDKFRAKQWRYFDFKAITPIMEPLMIPLMAHSVLRKSKTSVKECSLLTQNTNKNLNVQNYTSNITL